MKQRNRLCAAARAARDDDAAAANAAAARAAAARAAAARAAAARATVARADATPIASITGALLAALLAAGCTTTPRTPAGPPPPIAVDAIPGFFADPLDDLATALAQQCGMPKPPQPWPTLCATLPAGADPTALRTWLIARFRA
ncbi:MAG: hypothetical protein AB7O55_26255, partial [Lautropia sp.]